MKSATEIVPEIQIGPPPRWIAHRGFPKHRVRIASGGREIVRDLDFDRDLDAFVAGVRLGFSRRDPTLLERAVGPNEDDQIRREGILVGSLVAGVAIEPAHAPEDPPYILACEDVEEMG